VALSFKDQYENKISMSNFFYVKLKELADTTLLKREAGREHAVIMWQNEFMPLWFVLSVTANSQYNAMELSNRFYESGLFQYAEPDLMTGDSKNCTDDSEFWQQWALNNSNQNEVDIKACAAWEIATGHGVTVAVFDQGYDLSNPHPDLVANLLPDYLSFDSDSRTSPQQLRGNHGVPCMGIIAAEKNDIGIVGVAHNSKIMSISTRLDSAILAVDSRQHGINWAVEQGADVISNSWRSTPSAYVENAINNAVQNGRVRNGVPLGVVFTFAAGNFTYISPNLPKQPVDFPANLDNVIAVGGIMRDGRRGASQYGAELNVMAPGGGGDVLTTDAEGGYSNFGLTSAACPHVSGVAALILEVNPDLTWQQVKNIIERTAQKVGGYNYEDHLDHPNGTWHEEMGSGLVDAYAAVVAALEFSCIFPDDLEIVGSDILMEETEIYYVENLPAYLNVEWNFSGNVLPGQWDCFVPSPNMICLTSKTTDIDCDARSWVEATITYNNGTCSETLQNELTVNLVPSANLISTTRNSDYVPNGCMFRDTIMYDGQILDYRYANEYGIIQGEWRDYESEVMIQKVVDVDDIPGLASELRTNTSGFSQVQVRLENQCGWSDWQPVGYYPAYKCIEILYSPNPVNGELTIEFIELPDTEHLETYTVKLFDHSGNPRHQRQFKHRRRDGRARPVKFNTTSLLPGTYFLHVEGAGEYVREQIIVTQ
jgi:hypothetical protein